MNRIWESLGLRRCALAVVLAATFLYSCRAAMELGRSGRPYDLGDPENRIIIDGALSHPTFLSTFLFWNHQWIGAYRNYRPLTSLLHWIAFRELAPHGLGAYMTAQIVSDAGCVLVLFLFLRALMGTRLAVFSVLALNLAIGTLLNVPDTNGILNNWKDMHEYWEVAFYLGAAWAWLSYVRSEKASLRWLSLLLCFISIMFKEMAYTFPLIAILICLTFGRPDLIKRTWPLWVCVALSAITRTIVLHGLGTPGDWLYGYRRLYFPLSDIPFLFNMSGGYFLTVGMLALGLCIHYRSMPRLVPYAAGLIVAAAASMTGVVDDVPHAALVRPSTIISGLAFVAMWYAIVYLFFRSPNRWTLFGLAWVAATYLPLLLVGGGSGICRLYLDSMGWAIFIAGLLEPYSYWTPGAGFHPRPVPTMNLATAGAEAAAMAQSAAMKSCAAT